MKLRYNWPVLVWALVILFLCAIPGRDLPHSDWLEALSFDKWVHAGIFFVLEILSIRGLVFSTSPMLRRNAKWFTAAGAIAYGGALEIMQQALFSERTADIYDFIANSFGVIMGVALYSVLARKLPAFLTSKA
ncbi:MAG: VanZ family protein [Bacteroidia bacterium]|jgi:VanZ family protein|nr:VanZ family protein [Bacteroidia bacterium]